MPPLRVRVAVTESPRRCHSAGVEGTSGAESGARGDALGMVAEARENLQVRLFGPAVYRLGYRTPPTMDHRPHRLDPTYVPEHGLERNRIEPDLSNLG